MSESPTLSGWVCAWDRPSLSTKAAFAGEGSQETKISGGRAKGLDLSLLAGCVAVGKLLRLSVPWCPYLSKGIK